MAHRIASAFRPLVLVLALASAGCAEGSYLYDRGADLADAFALQGGSGIGLNATVKATDLLHTGLGFASTHIAGWRGRRYREIRESGEMGFLIGHTEDFRTDPHTQVGESCYISPLLSGDETDKDRKVMDRFFLEVRFEAIVALDFGFNPAEFLDFLAGFTTLDLGRDDAPPPAEDIYKVEPPKAEAPPVKKEPPAGKKAPAEK